MITYDPPAIMADFSRRRGITFPLLSDPGSQTIFGILSSSITWVLQEGHQSSERENINMAPFGPMIESRVHTFPWASVRMWGTAAALLVVAGLAVGSWEFCMDPGMLLSIGFNGGCYTSRKPMQSEDRQPRLDREQTDESLRVEREKADQTLEDAGKAFDETANAVISRARSRADEVLAAARASTDRQSPMSARGRPVPTILESERVREDQVLQAERANADEILRGERAEHLALLSRERRETDRDLSHERELSDEALATRDEFLGIVSHDLRNLLNAIVGSAALIENGVLQKNSVEQIVTHARRIQRSGARMNRLIGDLVDVASIEAGALAVAREVGDPSTVVTEAVDIFQVQAAAAGVSLAAAIVPPLSPCAFDAARILQVLSNLLSNAIKFTPAPGKIVVHVERFGDEIRFAVSDTGVGISADKLEAVFVRFLQVTENDRRGVGLGLYISKAIVHGHGGRIWAESTIGQGSTFSFTLPIQIAR